MRPERHWIDDFIEEDTVGRRRHDYRPMYADDLPEWQADSRSLGTWDLIALLLVIVLGGIVYAILVPDSQLRSLLDCTRGPSSFSYCLDIFVRQVAR